jgi:AcrR family transcriptional regulator
VALRLVMAFPDSDEIRDLLIEGAERQIASKGIEGFTFPSLAQALGIRLSKIYSQFSSREELIARVAARYGTALEEIFKDDESREPASVILDGAGALVHHFAKNPAHLRLELRDFETPGGLSALCLRNQRPPAEWTSRLSSIDTLLARGRRSGVIRAVDTVDLYRTLVGVSMMHIAGSQSQTWAGHRSGRISVVGNLVRDVVERYIRL